MKGTLSALVFSAVLAVSFSARAQRAEPAPPPPSMPIVNSPYVGATPLPSVQELMKETGATPAPGNNASAAATPDKLVIPNLPLTANPFPELTLPPTQHPQAAGTAPAPAPVHTAPLQPVTTTASPPAPPAAHAQPARQFSAPSSLPDIPQMNAQEKSKAKETKEAEKPAGESIETAETPAPKKKHKRRHPREVVEKRPLFNYRSQILPPTIYRSSYDKYNRHLPSALYPEQLDMLVFGAVREDNVNALRALLDSGRSLELRNVNGETPLIVAARYNAINCLRLLLARGADPSASDPNGNTALGYARVTGNYVMYKALETMGAHEVQAHPLVLIPAS
jgi:hypothetical protein